ncbi:MAG: DUF4952 domain-containing protein [Bacteroidota bacterium]
MEAFSRENPNIHQPTNATTPIPCGDILEEYAEKPPALNFVNCTLGEPLSQTVLTATYHVSGQASWEVEEFLVETYGMGALKWVCCGWENGGQYGSFNHEVIKAANPNNSAIISMYGMHEYEDEAGVSHLEMDRNKVPYFVVLVEIVEA